MRRRLTIGRLAFLGGIGGCVVIVALGVVSVVWRIELRAWRQGLLVSCGHVAVTRPGARHDLSWGPPHCVIVRHPQPHLSLRPVWFRVVGYFGTTYYLALWVLLVPCAGISVAAWWGGRIHGGKVDSCVTCGYNLTGLDEPRCPECGTGFDRRQLRSGCKRSGVNS